MLTADHRTEAAFSHLSLIGEITVKNPEGLDVSVSFSNGSYRAKVGYQILLLPLTNREAKEIILEQCPNLSPRFAELLVTLLSHHSWTSSASSRYPMI